MEGILLAGGFGTRLRSVVSDVPKCMAPIHGKPFLYYLLRYLEKAQFTHIILSLGYKHEIIEEWLPSFPTRMEISCVIEEEPLGTGGAVKFASHQAREENVFVLNGDTYFTVNFLDMLRLHIATASEATLALRKMYNFDRYGVVEVNTDNYRILEFKEKQFCKEGYINGGVYLIRTKALEQLPDKCSLEKDYFEQQVATSLFSGFEENGYFIDIGIPEDYAKIQEDFK